MSRNDDEEEDKDSGSKEQDKSETKAAKALASSEDGEKKDSRAMAAAKLLSQIDIEDEIMRPARGVQYLQSPNQAEEHERYQVS